MQIAREEMTGGALIDNSITRCSQQKLTSANLEYDSQI